MPRKGAASRVVLKVRRVLACSSRGVQHEGGGPHAHTVLHLIAPQHWEGTLGKAEDTHPTLIVQNEPGQVSRHRAPLPAPERVQERSPDDQKGILVLGVRRSGVKPVKVPEVTEVTLERDPHEMISVPSASKPVMEALLRL